MITKKQCVEFMAENLAASIKKKKQAMVESEKYSYLDYLAEDTAWLMWSYECKEHIDQMNRENRK